MSEAIRTVGVVLLVAMLATVLSELGFRGSRLISVLGVLAAVVLTLHLFDEVIGALEGIIELGGIEEIANSAIRIIGIGYVYGVASDICLDLGERGIALTVLGIGRVEILLLALPSVIKIVEGAIDMIGGMG